MSDALNEYLLGSDLIVAIGGVDAVGALDEYLGDRVTVSGASLSYTDRATVLAVQKAILAHPAYGEDAQLSLEPYRDDGVWGPVTAKAVARFNSEYAGLVAEQAGPRITDGTLQALGIAKPGKAAAKKPSASSPTVTTLPYVSPIPGVTPGVQVQASASSGNLALKIAAGALGVVGVGLVVAGIAGWARSRVVPR